MVNAQHKCLVRHFGGMLDCLASEIPFLALKTGTFDFLFVFFVMEQKRKGGYLDKLHNTKLGKKFHKKNVKRKEWRQIRRGVG